MTTETSPQPAAERSTTVVTLVLVLVGVLVAAAGLAAVFWPRDTREIDWSVVSVDLSRPDQVTVTFDVQKDPQARAECQVSAFRDATTADERRSWRLDKVAIRPAEGNARVTRHRVVVPTEGQATRATVANCVITDDGAG